MTVVATVTLHTNIFEMTCHARMAAGTVWIVGVGVSGMVCKQVHKGRQKEGTGESRKKVECQGWHLHMYDLLRSNGGMQKNPWHPNRGTKCLEGPTA